MEFEKAEWNGLTPEQQQLALQFVPDVMDKSLGEAFVACVAEEEQGNSKFSLKVGLGPKRVLKSIALLYKRCF